MLLEKEAITLKQCLYLLISSNCLLNAKVTIYDRGRPFYCNKDFIRIPLAEYSSYSSHCLRTSLII